MSFQIDLQFDPDPPRKAEPLKVYANVTLLEQTRCEGYRIDFTLTHPSGQQHHDSKHCNGLDPQTNEWHQLLDVNRPGIRGGSIPWKRGWSYAFGTVTGEADDSSVHP